MEEKLKTVTIEEIEKYYWICPECDSYNEEDDDPRDDYNNDIVTCFDCGKDYEFE